MSANRIVTVQEMREIEAASVRLGVSLDDLQRNAAAAVAREVVRLFSVPSGPAVFLVGPGNNGRDTLIAARILLEEGWPIRVYLAPKVDSEDLLHGLQGGGAAILAHGQDGDIDVLKQWVSGARVVVDGLLGIGIRGPAREPIARIIAAANEVAAARRVAVVSVDLPSGIDADTGDVPGEAIRARYTVSLGCVKAGLLRFPAAEYVGTLLPVEIGLPPATYQSVQLELLEADGVVDLIPRRPLGAHKGSFGRVLVVGGSRRFVGAPFLAGAAAARVGCGLVTLAVPEWQRAPLAALLPEATFLPLLGADDEESADADAQSILEELPDCDALAIGPGLGQTPASSRLVLAVLEGNRGGPRLPAVIDADALNVLAREKEWWVTIGPGQVLTPHPGEMSRLTGLGMEEIERDRWRVASSAAIRWEQVVVLKGALTVIAEPGGRIWVSPFANPALATGGTGDVLSGMIAGMLSQGAQPADAARAGVYLHGSVAEMVLEDHGVDRLLAGDLLPMIPGTIRRMTGQRGATAG